MYKNISNVRNMLVSSIANFHNTYHVKELLKNIENEQPVYIKKEPMILADKDTTATTMQNTTHPTLTYLKSAIETLEKDVKHFQS